MKAILAPQPKKERLAWGEISVRNPTMRISVPSAFPKTIFYTRHWKAAKEKTRTTKGRGKEVGMETLLKKERRKAAEYRKEDEGRKGEDKGIKTIEKGI